MCRSRVLSALLALAALLGPVASYAQATLEYPSLLQMQRFARSGQIRPTAHSGASSAAGHIATARALSVAAHPTQTLLVMWLISSVHAMREQNMIARIQNQSLSPSERADAAMQMAPMIFNGFDTYMGLLGGGIAGVGTSAALRATGLDSALMNLRELRAFSSTSAGRLAMRQFLVSGVVSLVTGTVWEISIQLREEAISMLDNADDIKAARELSFYRTMTGSGSDAEMRIFRQVNANMFEVLKDPNLVRMLIYNAWRLRLYRAEWALPMALAGAAGTGAWAMAPAGPWGIAFGLAGGVAGGVAAVFIPQNVRDVVNDGLWFTRERANLSRLEVSAREIQEKFNAMRSPFHLGPTAANQSELRGLFRARQRIREDLVTVWMEKLFRNHVSILETSELLLRIEVARQTPVAEGSNQILDQEQTRRELRARLESAKASMQATLRKVTGLYRGEYRRFMPMISRYERGMHNEYKVIVAAALEPVGAIHEHFLAFETALNELSPARAQFQKENPELFQQALRTAGLQMIQWNLRGFEEDSLRALQLNSGPDTTTD